MEKYGQKKEVLAGKKKIQLKNFEINLRNNLLTIERGYHDSKTQKSCTQNDVSKTNQSNNTNTG